VGRALGEPSLVLKKEPTPRRIVIHTLAFDSRGRLFVGDRQNNRIQIFDRDGKFIAQWFQFGRPSGIYIDKDDVIYVADSESRDGRGDKLPSWYAYSNI
jgi:DNA-binding beta-propeller fold protein YncE